MCGRFALAARPEAVAALCGLPEPPDLFARYNVAPTQLVAVVGDVGRGRRLALLRWGLIPSWAGADAGRTALINARAETVADKPSFRDALRHRRCLIPTSGFYEWAKDGGRRQPYLIRMKDGSPFALAGLWDVWDGPKGRVPSCAVITTAANGLVAPVHDRMPVILPPEDFGTWLDPAVTDPAELLPLLKPFPAGLMEAVAVGPRVNSTRNDDPGCAEPAA